MKPFIHQSFWSDSEIEKLDSGQKLAVLWIFTNPQMTLCGFCEVSERRFAFDTGLNPSVLWSTIEALPRAFKRFESANIVYSRRFIRHQFGSGEQLTRNNVFKSILSVFQGIRHEPLAQAIGQDYPEIETFLKPSQTPLKGEGREGEGKEVLISSIPRPSLEVAKNAGQSIGVDEAMVELWWHTREAAEWMKGTGGGGTTPVGRNWRADMKTFAIRESEKQVSEPPKTSRQKSAWDINTRISTIKCEIARLEERRDEAPKHWRKFLKVHYPDNTSEYSPTSPVHGDFVRWMRMQSFSPHSPETLAKIADLKTELEKLRQQLATA